MQIVLNRFDDARYAKNIKFFYNFDFYVQRYILLTKRGVSQNKNLKHGSKKYNFTLMGIVRPILMEGWGG